MALFLYKLGPGRASGEVEGSSWLSSFPSIVAKYITKHITTTKTTTMSKTIRIGVFIPHGAQTLDTACVDVLGVMSHEYLSAIPQLPAHVAALAPHVSVAYITTPTQGSNIPLTSGMTIRATHSYSDAEVAPGKLEVVLVPGPDPMLAFDDEGALAWLRAQAGVEGVDVLSICTGLFVCGAAGIADGKRASGPRGLQGMLKERFAKIELVGDEYRWVRDGNFWSSGESSSPTSCPHLRILLSPSRPDTGMHAAEVRNATDSSRRRDQRQRPHGGVRAGEPALAAARRRDRAAADRGGRTGPVLRAGQG